MENEIRIGVATAFLQLKDMGFFDEIRKAQSALGDLDDSAKGLSLKDVATGMTNLGDAWTRNVSLPIARGAKDVIQTYRDMESAFTGVKKTIDDTRFAEAFGDQVDGWEILDNMIRQISQSTASTYEEVAGVMEWAGQLNVPLGKGGKSIEEFTRVMVELGDSTNLTAEESAESIAKLMNIMGTSPDVVRNLGSSIVDLGNNSATTERDIVQMAMRLAGAGAQAGLTEQEVLGIATALTSVGIRAEMGGSAMSKAIVKMQVAVETGYDKAKKLEQATGMTLRDLELMSTNNTSAFKELAQSLNMTTTEIKDTIKSANELNDFADIAGVTTEEFVNLYKTDAVGALEAFIIGLGDTESHGQSAIAMLDEMGIREIRLRDTLLRVSGAQGLLTDSVDRANKAWDDGTALSVEAEKRYATLDSQINQLNERWKDMKYDIAEILVPVLGQLMDVLDDLIAAWKDLSPEQQQAIVKTVGIIAVIGPLLSILGRLLGAIANIHSFIQIFRQWNVLGTLATNISKLSPAMQQLFPTFSKFFSFVGGKFSALGTTVSTFGTKISTGIGAGLKAGGTAVFNFLAQDVGTLAASGAAGVATTFTVGLFAAIGGYWAGNKLGKLIFPDDAELYDQYAGFEGFWNLCKDTATTVAEEIGYKWDDLKEKVNISESWNDAKQGISDWFTGVGETASETKDNLAGFFGEMGQGLEDTTVKAAQWVVDLETKADEAGREFSQNTQKWFDELPYNVGYGIGYAGVEISKWAIETRGKAIEAGENFVNSTEEFFSQVPEKVENHLVTTAEGVVQFEEDMSRYAKETGDKFVEGFKTLEELPNVAGLVWEDVKTNAKQFGEDFKGAAKLAGEDFKNNIWTPITEIPGKMKEKFGDILSQASAFGKDLMSKGKKAAADFGNGLIQTVKNIPEEFKKLGNNIVQGVWNGIVGAKDRFMDNVNKFFKGIVDGAKSSLGIRSPSTIFRDEVGRWIPLGIVEGVEEEMPGAISDVEKMLDKGVQKMTPEVEMETSVEDFSDTFRDSFYDLLRWMQSLENQFIMAIDNMSNSMLELNKMGNEFIASDYSSYGTINQSSVNSTQSMKSMLDSFLVQLSTIVSSGINYAGGNENAGNITIPVYIGSELIDTVVVTANQRNNYRSGGR